MIIKVYYAGGRIDVFDTNRMTDGVPQSSNLLTNYTLDLADVNGECLRRRTRTSRGRRGCPSRVVATGGASS